MVRYYHGKKMGARTVTDLRIPLKRKTVHSGKCKTNVSQDRDSEYRESSYNSALCVHYGCIWGDYTIEPDGKEHKKQ